MSDDVILLLMLCSVVDLMFFPLLLVTKSLTLGLPELEMYLVIGLTFFAPCLIGFEVLN